MKKDCADNAPVFSDAGRPSVIYKNVCYGRNYDDLVRKLMHKIRELEERIEILESRP